MSAFGSLPKPILAKRATNSNFRKTHSTQCVFQHVASAHRLKTQTRMYTPTPGQQNYEENMDLLDFDTEFWTNAGVKRDVRYYETKQQITVLHCL